MAQAPATTGDRVTVGNKLPFGLLIQLERRIETVDADGRTVKKYVPDGERVLLNGANSSGVIGGYGLTENVNAELFDRWMKQDPTFAPLAQGLVFVQSTTQRAASEAKDRAKLLTGLEPIDPDNPGFGLAKATET